MNKATDLRLYLGLGLQLEGRVVVHEARVVVKVSLQRRSRRVLLDRVGIVRRLVALVTIKKWSAQGESEVASRSAARAFYSL